MKKALLLLAILSASLVTRAQNANADPAAINIIASPDTIAVGATATVSFTLQNMGTDPIPPGGATWNIIFPGMLTVNQASLNGVNMLFTPVWNVTPGVMTSLLLETAQMLPPGMPVTITVQVTGANAGQAPLQLLAESNPPTGNTNVANDNAVGNITVTPANPVPVELISFKGSLADHRTARLSWQTGNAVRFSHFELERSVGGAFGKVATIPYNGQYQYELNDPINGQAGNILYRLRMIDQDGSFRLSPVVLVRTASVQEGLSLYPNPAANRLSIKGISAATTYRIRTWDGRSVQTGTLNADDASIDISTLPAGNYLMEIVTEDGSSIMKIVKP